MARNSSSPHQPTILECRHLAMEIDTEDQILSSIAKYSIADMKHSCYDDTQLCNPMMNDIISGYSLPHFSFILHSFLPSWRLQMEEVLARDLDHTSTYNEMIRNIGLSHVTQPLCTGSFFEGLQVPLVLENGSLDLPDIDIMFVMKHMVVGFNPTLFNYVIDDSETHLGYARIWSVCVPENVPKHYIKDERSGRYYISSEEITDGLKRVLSGVYAQDDDKYSAVEAHGPAVMKEDKRGWDADMFSKVKRDDSAKFRRSTDIVLAFPCPEFPPVAMEWITRERHYAWPWHDLITGFLSKGCHLVGSSHSTSVHKSIEWRWSFSEVEKLIAQSLNPTQRQCYILLKIILKEELSFPSVLCSYHLKTLLYWTCEETPLSFWTAQNLGTCLLHLLDKFIGFLSERNLPNYFVRENNLLDHIHPDFLETIGKKLINTRQDPLLVIFRFARNSKFLFSPETAPLEALCGPSIEAMTYYKTNSRILDSSYEDTTRNLALQYVYEGRIDLAEGVIGGFIDFVSTYGPRKSKSPFQLLLGLIETEEQKAGYLDNQITILEELKMKWRSDTVYCSRICRQLGLFYQMKACAEDTENFAENINKSESSLRFALRIDENSSVNHFYLGRLLCFQKKYEEARIHLLFALEKEKQLEQYSGNELLTPSHNLFLDEYLRKEMDNMKYILCPMVIFVYYYLTMACVYTNKTHLMEEMMADYEVLAHLASHAKPQFVICLSMLGYSYLYLSRKGDAERAFALAMSFNTDYTLSLDAMQICADDSD